MKVCVPLTKNVLEPLATMASSSSKMVLFKEKMHDKEL